MTALAERWVQFTSDCAITGGVLYVTQRMDEWLVSHDLLHDLTNREIKAALLIADAVEVRRPECLGAVDLAAHVERWLETTPHSVVLKLTNRANISVSYLKEIAAGHRWKPSAHVLKMLGLRVDKRYYKVGH